jgi:hypothetical protein
MLRTRTFFIPILCLFLLPETARPETSVRSGRIAVFRLNAGSFRIERDRVRISDFGTTSETGAPDLPSKTFRFNLGPAAEILDVEIVPGPAVPVDGPVDIAPVEPLLALSDETPASEPAVPRGAMYGRDGYWPDSPAVALEASSGAKGTEVRVRFTPLRYNPVRRSLLFVETAEVRVRYAAPAGLRRTGAPAASSGADAPATLLIITSSALRRSVEPFAFWKRSLGDSVRIADTESIYAAVAGAERADKLRAFIRDAAAESGVTDVLLVGHRDVVPMKKTYPNPLNHAESGAVPSDLYLADLDGEWDADGDGYCGEYPDDGVDGSPEVRVGRIPWSDSTTVAAVLGRIVEYERNDDDRKRVPLMAAGILNYRYEGGGAAYSEKTDGAVLMDYLRERVFDGAPAAVLYEKDGVDASPAGCTLPLTRDNLSAAWSAGGFGCATWWLHGNSESVSRKIWLSDDGDGIPESAELSWENLISVQSRPSCAGLPPVVFANACENGWPEKTSLGRELIRSGCAAVLASSRTSWYAAGWADPSDGGNASLTAFFWEAFLNSGQGLGGAVSAAREEYLDRFGAAWQHWQNALTLVLYGDPTLSVRSASPHWGSLSGVLLSEENGGSVAGPWRVSLEGTGRTGETDAVGRFDFERIPGGRYVLVATSPDGIESRSDVEFMNGVRSNASVPVRTRPVVHSGISTADTLLACRVEKGFSAEARVLISNPGDGILIVRALREGDADWLAPDSSRIFIPPGSTDTLRVRFSAEPLPAGEYRSRMILRSNAVPDSVLPISVALTVVETVRQPQEPVPLRAGIAVADTLLACRVQKGLYAKTRIRISNPGDGILRLRAFAEGAAWMLPDSAALEIGPGRSDSLSVLFSAKSLPSGEFRCELVLHSNAAPDPVFILPAVLAVIDTIRAGSEADTSAAASGADPAGEPPAVSRVETGGALPRETRLAPNHPNPFNGGTRIGFSLSERSEVRITVLDAFGRTVNELVRAEKAPGVYAVEWDAADEAGRPVVSGLYLVRMTAGGRTETRKMLLVR